MSDPTPVLLTRRTVLGLLGAGAAAAALGACSAAGSDGSQSPGGTPGRRIFRAAYPYEAPPKGHFNLLTGVAEGIRLGYLIDLVQLPGAMYNWQDQTYYHLLADPSSGFAADRTTFSYVVRDGLSWSDGTPVTAKDVYSTWLLQAALGHSAHQYVTSFEQTDERTVTFQLSKPAPVVEYYLLRLQIVPDIQYGPLAAEVEPLYAGRTLKESPDLAALTKKIGEFRPDAPLANGPFAFDPATVTDAQLELVKNPTGYLADTVAWDGILVHNGQTEAVTPLVLAEKIDYATHAFPVATTKQLEQQGFRILRPPVHSGLALYFSFGRRPEFADKRVRQALAHAIDRSQQAEVTFGDSGRPGQYMSGMSDVQVEQWLGESDRGKLAGYEFDRDKAEQLLLAAGWRRDGATWITSAGTPATYDISYPTQLIDYAAAAQNVAGQLNEWGFEIVQRGGDNTQVRLDIGKGEFDLAILTWGMTGNPFPSEAYIADFLTFNYAMLAPDRGIDFPLTQQTDAVGEIDLEQAVIDSAVGASPEELKGKATTLALAFNELLPIVPLVERYANNPVLTSAVTGYPDDDASVMQNSIYADNPTAILMFDGTLEPA
ncbi:ABC transporter substrate-binding protein [Jiangella alba]|uniref:Peptide/nickel transport system substrate-binding protein n=1 Tax=Jiangella alba TaxID=561176 RepID=A0A1H5PW11_9ACTN|nr:ABC transporter substrate-binding protein [Jiangella alba]SEF17996.1 peptide/nickel transport system substrate-binding protein [Jiangella alba]